MKKFNVISAIAWLIISVLIFIESLALDLGTFNFPGPGFFPFLTSVSMAFLSGLLLWSSVRQRRGKEDNTVVWAKDIDWRKIILTLLSLFVYVFFLEKLGYILTTFLLMVFLFKIIEPQKWSVAILSSSLAVLATYIIFSGWLQAQFPKGWLGF
jgi:putative tricarboxylic transport membrane protein